MKHDKDLLKCLRNGINLSQPVSGFRVIETKSDKPMKSLDKQKPKELEWEKELDILFSNKVLLGYEPPTISLKEFIKQTLTQQRTELLEEIKMFPLLIRKEPEAKGYNLAVKEINNKITNLLNKK